METKEYFEKVMRKYKRFSKGKKFGRAYEWLVEYAVEPQPGAVIPPSIMDSSMLGITAPGSTRSCSPKPVQTGQAP